MDLSKALLLLVWTSTFQLGVSPVEEILFLNDRAEDMRILTVPFLIYIFSSKVCSGERLLLNAKI